MQQLKKGVDGLPVKRRLTHFEAGGSDAPAVKMVMMMDVMDEMWKEVT